MFARRSRAPPARSGERRRPQSRDRYVALVVVQLDLYEEAPARVAWHGHPDVPGALVVVGLGDDGDIPRLRDLIAGAGVEELPSQRQAIASVALDPEVERDQDSQAPEFRGSVGAARELLAVQVLAEADVAVQRGLAQRAALVVGVPSALRAGRSRSEPPSTTAIAGGRQDRAAHPRAAPRLLVRGGRAPGGSGPRRRTPSASRSTRRPGAGSSGARSGGSSSSAGMCAPSTSTGMTLTSGRCSARAISRRTRSSGSSTRR